MASVSVFVDDAVRGRLPHVCVETGQPADGKLVLSRSRGGVGPGVLLILLGPIGWIALFVIACLARRETLTVSLGPGRPPADASPWDTAPPTVGGRTSAALNERRHAEIGRWAACGIGPWT